MTTIKEIVNKLLRKDEFAFEAYRRQILNYRAFAREIQAEVARITYKPVKIGTIVVALVRLEKELLCLPSIKSDIKLSNITIQSPLKKITIEKTVENRIKLAKCIKEFSTKGEFISFTQGIDEITIILAENLFALVQQIFNNPFENAVSNLTAVTVSFSEEYLSVPNVLYTLISKIASNHINIVELISTNTELTFIVNATDMIRTTEALEQFWQK